MGKKGEKTRQPRYHIDSIKRLGMYNAAKHFIRAY